MSGVADTFDALVGSLDYPMFIVTATAGDEREGCLVGFATQSSIDPPRFVVCLSKNNRTYRMAKDADSVAVHMVPEDALVRRPRGGLARLRRSRGAAAGPVCGAQRPRR